ncbi:MAG: urease accessory protein UreD [Mycobacteriales bacterium]
MALDAVARAVARDVDGRTRLTTVRSAVPLSVRETVDGLTLVASAFGPLGGDTTRLELAVQRGARLRVGSAAAQIAQPGVHDRISRAAVDVDVGPGAHLHWQPQPTVVTAGAEHHVDLDVRVAETGSAVLVETAVLGRCGETPGRYRSRWRVTVGHEPLLSTDLDIGPGAHDGWNGPATTGGARVLVAALVVGAKPHLDDGRVQGGEVLDLAGPGVLYSWLGDDTVSASRAVAVFLAKCADLQHATSV